MHFYSWKLSLKTRIYYLRTKPRATAQKFTIEPKKKNEDKEEEIKACKLNDPECLSCGS